MNVSITWLADALRKEGCKVKECSGWKNAGRPASTGGFNPYGVLWHHTAGPKAGPNNPAPSLQTVIHGRPDLPGPLAHVLIGWDGTCHVVAAGRANHAGECNGFGPFGYPTGVAFSPDSKTVFSSGEDGTVRQWDWEKGKEVKRFHIDGEGVAVCVAVSRDGRYVACGHSSPQEGVAGGLRVWRTDRNRPEVCLDEPLGVHLYALTFHPDGRRLAVGHTNRSIM